MTRRRIELDDEAKAEMRRAYRWYVERNPTRAEELEEDFTQAFVIIAEEGEMLPSHEGEARRILLQKYP